jgi:hypothetical protein
MIKNVKYLFLDYSMLYIKSIVYIDKLNYRRQ